MYSFSYINLELPVPPSTTTPNKQREQRSYCSLFVCLDYVAHPKSSDAQQPAPISPKLAPEPSAQSPAPYSPIVSAASFMASAIGRCCGHFSSHAWHSTQSEAWRPSQLEYSNMMFPASPKARQSL